MKGSIIVVSFFALGVLLANFGLVPKGVVAASSDAGYYVLCALMFSVGVSIGCDSKVLGSLRSIDLRLMLLPLATILGSLGGVAFASAFFPGLRIADGLAVGAGLGYYSLSSIFITEYRGAELGTVALLSNILRELVALLFAPLLARLFGKLAPISAGGATTMDTTLPIITTVSGREFVTVSVFHGFVTDFSVPFLVTFFCSL